MQMRIKILLLVICVCSALVRPAQPAIASVFQLSGKVVDGSGAPIAGATVDVLTAGTTTVSVSATTDSAGNYALFVDAGTYDVRVLPQAGSGFQTLTVINQTVVANATLNFVLVSAGIVTLSGRVIDSRGGGVASQQVHLDRNDASNASYSGVSDATGHYTLNVVPGTYFLSLGSSGGSAPNAPQSYSVNGTSTFVISQNTILDIELPAKFVSVHVQDASGNPVGGVSLGTSQVNNNGLTMTTSLGVFSGSGGSSSAASTDVNGNATLALLPTPVGQGYRLYAYPPQGSSLSSTQLDNVAVTADMAVTITFPIAVTLSGRVIDSRGGGVASQQVHLDRNDASNASYSGVSDATGHYTLNVVPGTYFLSLGSSGGSAPNAPQSYSVNGTSTFVISQNTILDIELPAKFVSVHVQDASGNPVGGVSLGTSQVNNNGLTMTTSLGVFSGSGGSSSAASTDVNGNAILALLLTPVGQGYRLYAYPPQGSPFADFSINSVVVMGDITQIVVLQFIHPPPVTTAQITPLPNAQGVYLNPATVVLTSMAHTSFAVAATYFTVDGGNTQTYTAPFVVLGVGGHTVRYWSVDNIGVAELPKTRTFQIADLLTDSTPPTANPTQSPTANGAGWNNTDVSVIWNWSDNLEGSGLDLTHCTSSTTATAEGVLQLSATCKDNVGNIGNATYALKIDKTKPVITATAMTAPNASNWYSGNVIVHFTCTDALSSIPAGACPPDQVLTAEGAAIASTSRTVSDAAGNGSNPSNVVTVKIDKMPPTVSSTLITAGLQATVTVTASDGLSGIAGIRYSINGGASVTYAAPIVLSGVGFYTISYTSTDTAGNSASGSRLVQILHAFSGFFQPVDNLPTLNAVKAGSAIPVKFSLGGNQGLAIFATGYPVSQKITCDSSAPIDDIEQTVTAGSSGLQYDAASGQYSYVWKTDKSWVGTCRQLILRLMDGTDHKANFKFK